MNDTNTTNNNNTTTTNITTTTITTSNNNDDDNKYNYNQNIFFFVLMKSLIFYISSVLFDAACNQRSFQNNITVTFSMKIREYSRTVVDSFLIPPLTLLYAGKLLFSFILSLRCSRPRGRRRQYGQLKVPVVPEGY